MAGEIEEPFRFHFQADLLQSGSISFGRFESESLSWERRSSFSHNRYLEEVEKYSKPGSVTEKKAYFEAHFRRKALLKQTSSESQHLQESESGNGINPSKYDEETETLCSENGHDSRNVCDLSYQGSEIRDDMVSGLEKNKLEETHEIRTNNVVLVESIISDTRPITETKQIKPKLKASQAKTREGKGLRMMENEKKSTRLVSPVTHSGRKTSKTEESNMSSRKAEILPASKSLVKTFRSEKTMQTKSQLPGTRQTVNRSKQTITTPSKPRVNQSGERFTVKSDQRLERRKEEKLAAELIQSGKTHNFKATPMPSFYKQTVNSNTPNKPQTSSTAQTAYRISAARPSSSTSLTNKNRPPECRNKVYVPEKDSSSQKQKKPEVTKGKRAENGKHCK